MECTAHVRVHYIYASFLPRRLQFGPCRSKRSRLGNRSQYDSPDRKPVGSFDCTAAGFCASFDNSCVLARHGNSLVTESFQALVQNGLLPPAGLGYDRLCRRRVLCNLPVLERRLPTVYLFPILNNKPWAMIRESERKLYCRMVNSYLKVPFQVQKTSSCRLPLSSQRQADTRGWNSECGTKKARDFRA